MKHVHLQEEHAVGVSLELQEYPNSNPSTSHPEASGDHGLRMD